MEIIADEQNDALVEVLPGSLADVNALTEKKKKPKKKPKKYTEQSIPPTVSK